MIGTRIGNYEINSFIEEGGMGTVYSGTHIKLDRKVAVKVLHKNLTSNSQFRERFLNEAKILAKLSHPNIINIYDFIEQDEQYYIITEFVEGISLDKIVADRNAATAEMKLEYFRQILSGIGYAHSHGVVHRDIKPSNVMIEMNTTAKILDFGIAKLSDASKSLTKTGTKMGSLYYMSPEQVLGHVMDSRTDIYSLGVMLFEMLTNNLPYKTKTESDYELMNSILAQELPNLHEYVSGIDPNIEYAIRKACAKEPVNRFQTCEEFAGALKNSRFTFYAPSIDHSKTILTSGSQTEFTGNRTVYQPQPEQTYAAPSSSKSKSTTSKVGLILGITSAIIVLCVTIYLMTLGGEQDKVSHSESGTISSKPANSESKVQSNVQKTYAEDKSSGSDLAKSEIRQTIVSWIECWQDKNLECYSQFISSDYLYLSSTGNNREQNRNQRLNTLRKQFSERDYIVITYSNLKINLISDDRAVANYYQTYTSDQYSDSGNKEVTLLREGNLWKVLIDKFYK